MNRQKPLPPLPRRGRTQRRQRRAAAEEEADDGDAHVVAEHRIGGYIEDGKGSNDPLDDGDSSTGAPSSSPSDLPSSMPTGPTTQAVAMTAESYSCPIEQPVSTTTANNATNSTAPPILVSNVTFAYDYELVHPDGADAAAYLPALEGRMLGVLAVETGMAAAASSASDGDDYDCEGYEVSGRRTRRRSLRRRAEEGGGGDDATATATTKIIGIASSPADAVDEDNGCLVPSSSCTAINGWMTASYTGTNEAGAVIALTRLIREGMVDGSFLAGNNDDGLDLSFVGTRSSTTGGRDDLPPSVNVASAKNDPPAVPDDSDNVSDYGIAFVTFMAAGIVLIVGLFVSRARRRSRRRKDEEVAAVAVEEDTYDMKKIENDLAGERNRRTIEAVPEEETFPPALRNSSCPDVDGAPSAENVAPEKECRMSSASPAARRMLMSIKPDDLSVITEEASSVAETEEGSKDGSRAAASVSVLRMLDGGENEPPESCLDSPSTFLSSVEEPRVKAQPSQRANKFEIVNYCEAEEAMIAASPSLPDDGYGGDSSGVELSLVTDEFVSGSFADSPDKSCRWEV